MCLSVREDISGTKRAIFIKFLCMLPMAMARSRCPLKVKKYQGEGTILGVSSPLTIHFTAYHLGPKTADPTEMPFGTMTGLGPRYSMLRGGDDPRREGAFLRKHVPDKPTIPLIIAN